VEREGEIRVTLDGGRSVTAQLAGRDPGTDLAVLRAPLDGVPVVQQSAAALAVGRIVLALGRPWEGDATASLGVISALGGEYRTWHGGRIDRLVRLDIAIQDGFSGGPLVDARGEVLGINTSGLARRGAVTVPAATVERVTTTLLEKGRVARGYLGIGLQPVRLTESLRRASVRETGIGLLVTHVESDGPAEHAGVLLGDIVVGVNGHGVRDLRDVAAQLGPESIGQRIPFELLRGGHATALEIEVRERAGEEE
jgi:S1-C subfamily serine protease